RQRPRTTTVLGRCVVLGPSQRRLVRQARTHPDVTRPRPCPAGASWCASALLGEGDARVARPVAGVELEVVDVVPVGDGDREVHREDADRVLPDDLGGLRVELLALLLVERGLGRVEDLVELLVAVA